MRISAVKNFFFSISFILIYCFLFDYVVIELKWSQLTSFFPFQKPFVKQYQCLYHNYAFTRYTPTTELRKEILRTGDIIIRFSQTFSLEVRLIKVANKTRPHFRHNYWSKQQAKRRSRPQWTKNLKNFALSCSQETHPANLAPWWPLPSPRPGQCCLGGSKNVPATLQLCFLGGEEEVSWVNRALEGSILKLDIQRAFFLTFLSKIWIVVWCLKCVYFVATKNGLNNSFDLKSAYEYLKCFGTDK